MKIPHTWDDANFTWDDNKFKWEDAYRLLEQIDNQGGGVLGWSKLKEEDKKKFIKVVVAVKGEKFKESKGKFKDYKVTAADIEMIRSEVKLKIDSVKVTKL